MSMQEANDPKTPPDKLEALAKSSKDTEMLSALAENPSTPAHVLFAVARFFPERFLCNPLLPLLLLERANLSQLPEETACALLRLPELPAFYVAALSSHPSWCVVMESVVHPKLSETLRQECAARLSEHQLLSIVCRPSAPVAVLSVALRHTDQNIQEKAIVHRDTPFSLLQEFTNAVYEELWGLIAMNPNTPTEVLRLLSQTESLSTLRQIASNPNTEVALLRQLALREEEEVRIGIAYNPAVPPEILRGLCEDPSEGIRIDLACNEGLPPDALDILAVDEDEQVRSCLARRVDLPRAWVRRFCVDERWEVRTALAGNQRVIESLLREERSIVERLSADESHYVRASVARNPSAPATILARLANDPAENVREGAATNPNTPPEDLRRLLRDVDFMIVERAKQNPNTPIDAMLQMTWGA
jgi:hypothetical protein